MVVPAAAAASFFPTTLAGWGGVASAAGGILSGLGIGGKKKRGPSEADMYTMNRNNIMNEIKARVDGAKENGLSPLVTMGVPTSSLSFNQPDNGKSFDPAEIGQGINRAFTANQTAMQRKMDELALENAELSNDFIRLQMAGAAKALNRAQVPPPVETGLPETANTSSNIVDQMKAWKSGRMDIDNGLAPIHKVAVNKDGQPIRVLNSDVVGDNEVLMLIDAVTNTLPDMARGKIRHFLDLAKKSLKPSAPSKPRPLINHHL